jgi:ABC-type sulfate/molybdate transport systems ATPase subunit
MVSNSSEPFELSFRLQVNASSTLTRLDVEATVPPGITVLFGASGAGKSTTLSALAGLIRPRSGRIQLGRRLLFDAKTRINLPAYERRIALVFQTLALFPHLSVSANVAYGLPRELAPRERMLEVRHWLERMRVSHVADRQPTTLSGGEAQRVALARALASKPHALLLDEPFSALDSPLRRELGREVVGIVSELGIPTLLVTHDRADATELSERVIVLDQGRVTDVGDPKAVLGSQI